MYVYDRPATDFVGGFIGNPPMNFLRGRLERSNGTSQVALGDHKLDAPLMLTQAGGQDVIIGIRAENIEASARPTPDALLARTEVVEPVGSHLLVTALIGEQRLKLLTRTDFPAKMDAPLWIRPEPDKLRWFDAKTGQEIAGAPAR